MARLAISKGFLGEYARLDRHVQTAVDQAIAAFAEDVRGGTFPSDAESYHGSAELGDALG